ncbi:MAG: UvrD-helicase domain-containing protein [Sporichthyaceae bacterium]
MTEPADSSARTTIRTDFGRTLFVEAGAGTGKTYALVTRVVHMVATGHLAQMSQLAAITFTENAAAELRSRIRQGLLEASEGEHADYVYDENQRKRCRAALDDLEDAVLTTLHGFASRILAEAPLEAGLPPGFSVEEGAAGEAADRAWDAFVDELLDDSALRDHILAGLTLALNLRALREIADLLGASWDRLRDRPLREVPLPPIDAGAVIAHLRVAVADEAQWPDDGLAAHLLEMRVLADDLATLGDPLDVLDALNAVELGSRAGNKTVWSNAGLDKAAIADALQQAEDARAQLLAAVGAAVTSTLAARVQDWLLARAEVRRREGALAYHDLLVLARDVLRSSGPVRARLHALWPTLLIDEFQDTDPLQVEIAYLLAAEWEQHPPVAWDEMRVEGSRLFFVGDAKQSIYRFRRADIDIFTAVGAHHPHAALSVNFRSVPGVLAAVNHAFDRLIGDDDRAGIAYDHLAASRTMGSAEAPVLLLGGPCDLPAPALRTAEATHLADVAVRAKRDGWLVGTDEAKPGRPASYRDMAILLPTRTSLPALEKALQVRGVPYRIESRSLVWSTDAVRGVVAILAAVDNPADEVALLAALRNPGLACSDVDLVQWRAWGGRWSLFAETPEAAPQDHPVAAALRTLRAWHEQRWWTPVNELVEEVVRDLRLIELTAAQLRPRDHWRRLRFVLDQARAWCDAGGSGLAGFVAWARRQMEEDVDVMETVVPEPDDDAVRILTVHGSKGLEFGITMVAGLGAAADRPMKVVWTDDGPQVRLRAGVLETPGWSAAVPHEREQERREAIRLLYVALTRAMDHLVVGCYHRPPKTGKQSRAQLVWGLLAGGALAATELAPPAALEDPSMEVPVSAIPLPDRAAFAEARATLLAAVAQRVATSPTARTAAAAAQAAPAKPEDAGVEPAKVAAETAPEQEAEPARVQRSSRRGAAIGTATHRVLELADLANPSTSEIAALARMACAAADIPELVKDVESRAWSALRDDSVAGPLAAGARPHSEVYLVVPDGDRFLEGYVDLLFEAPDGALTVLDYKTDRATTPDEIAAKQARYAPQLAAYVDAVEQVTGRRPDTAALVFARPGGAPPQNSV